MNIPQLRSFCEVVRQNMSVSRAADALHTSQPGISRQLRELEEELGVMVLARSRNRIIGLTEAGEALIEVARTIIADAERMKFISRDFTDSKRGSLVVATTHAHARYSLPAVVKQFGIAFPLVQLNLSQGNPSQCAHLVVDGSAALGIAAEVDQLPGELVAMPAFCLRRSVIAAKGHPILRNKRLTLDEIAKHPLITYDRAYGMQALLHNAFEAARIKPNIVLRAIDADVIKTYVELGLGIAVVSSMVYDADRDRRLGVRDVTHLFKPGYVNIYARRGGYLRDYAIEFIRTYAPHLSKAMIVEAIEGRSFPPAFFDKTPYL
jgi:LysR family cys regulon transcriptional activator